MRVPFLCRGDHRKSAGGPAKTPGYNVAYVGNLAFSATEQDVTGIFTVRARACMPVVSPPATLTSTRPHGVISDLRRYL